MRLVWRGQRGATLDRAECSGALTGWVVNIPLPGSETQPARPVRQKSGGPRRNNSRRGPSTLRPDDGPRSCGPSPQNPACHPEHPADTGENRCVPSPEAAGHACGPRARARRRLRPRVLETLALARGWQEMIAGGEVKNAAQIAQDLGVTRARVSQVMALLRLAPAILDHIDDMDGDEGCLHLTERKLRRIALTEDQAEQVALFEELVGMKLAPRTPQSPRGASDGPGLAAGDSPRAGGRPGRRQGKT